MSLKPTPFAVTLGACVCCSVATVASANQVTYQVDLGIQITIGNFVPGSDGVSVAGTFNAWATPVSLTNVPGTTVYRNTLPNTHAVDEWENHKFIIDHAGGPAEWEAISGDRFFQITAEDQVLPVVFFSDLEVLPDVALVTWTVDMSVQTELGRFVPSFADEVYLAGEMNGWAAPFETGELVLTNSTIDTNLWSGTFEVSSTVGSTINYKFIMLTDSTVWERDGLGPGGVQNRQFIFTNQTTTLPVVFFNDETVSATATQSVAFTVSLAAQIARGDVPPTPPNVWVAGDMTAWSPVALTQVPTNTTAWTGSLEVTGVMDSTVAYKFVYEGDGATEVWEDDGVGGTPGPRQLAITGVDTNVQQAHFNDVDNLGTVSIAPSPGGRVTLEWTGGPLIRLQTGSSVLGAYGDVPGSEGIGTTNLSLGADAAYFRLTGP